MKSILIIAALVGFGAGWILKSDEAGKSPVSNPEGAQSKIESQTSQPLQLLAWTQPQIQSLGNELRNQLHPVKRKILIDQILEGMTAENADAIRQALSPMYYPDPRFIAFYRHWGQLAGADVINLFGGKPKQMIFAGWSQTDPLAARDWAAAFESETHKLDPAFHADLVVNLGKINPAEATAYYFDHLNKSGSDNALRTLSNQIRETQGISGWVTWAESLPHESYRQTYITKVAKEWIEEDFESARKWVETLKSPDGRWAVLSVASHWKNQQGFDWALTVKDEALRKPAIEGAMRSWLRAERDEAMAFVQNLEPSPQKDLALHASMYQAKFPDFEDGLDWVSQISDPVIRDQAFGDWAFHWYPKDPKVADQWIDQSDLSEDAKESYHKFKDTAR